ncbi:MAG: chemotaxis protein CheA [Candidatus Methylomirabilia bacterium]
MINSLEHLDDREIGELRSLFFAQSGELLDQVQASLLHLEHDGADPETLRSVKRALHTIKGDATSMGFENPGHLCHRLEDVLAAMTADPERNADGVEVLIAGMDALTCIMGTLEAGGSGTIPPRLLERIEGFLEPVGGAGQTATAEPLTEYQRLQAREAVAGGLQLFEVEISLHPGCREPQVGALMVRERLRQAGKLVALWPDPERGEVPAAAIFRFLAAAADLGTLRAATRLPGVVACATVRPWKQTVAGDESAAPPAQQAVAQPVSERSEVLRVEASKIDQILDLVGELIIGRSMLGQAAREAAGGSVGPDFAERLHAVNAYLERTVADLQKNSMRMRMVPIRFLFKKFPRVVRDLSRQLGKQVRLELEGQGTELDKGIVDALFEPLTHLVRNMADHGLETPEERRAAGKGEEGLITLRAYQEAARIVIEVADDGRGIDTARLKRRAVERGFLGEAEAGALSREEALQLVFLSGLSTAEQVTETSGRGVGMDAVKSAVAAVKGFVEIESQPGVGTCFRLRLPLTLAVIRTLLFEAGGRLFALPVAAIAEVARIRSGEVTTVDGRNCLLLRDQVVSVISLGELFRLPAAAGEGGYLLVLALRGRRFGLLVDRLHSQQELVIKPVDDRWLEAGTVAGASILGDGRVVLILDALGVVSRAIVAERARLEAP